MKIDFILIAFTELFTTVSWRCHQSLDRALSIYGWLPASRSLPFAWGIYESIGGSVTHLEGREELGGAPGDASHTKHLQRTGSLASVSLFRAHALWWAGQNISERVPEKPVTRGQKENVKNKVRTRGWKGDWKVIPFGSGSLKKEHPAMPFLLIQITCDKNHTHI